MKLDLRFLAALVLVASSLPLSVLVSDGTPASFAVDGGTAPSCSWTGTWDTMTDSTYLRVQLTQTGTAVAGTYGLGASSVALDVPDDRRLEGTVTSNRLTGRWWGPPTYAEPDNAGWLNLDIAADCNSFIGSWGVGPDGSHPAAWRGSRTSTLGSACSWGGEWNTTTKGQQLGMQLTQASTIVRGTYGPDSRRIEAAASPYHLTGRWSAPPTYAEPIHAGQFTLDAAWDCRSFTGTWGFGDDDNNGGLWIGLRTVQGNPPSIHTPADGVTLSNLSPSLTWTNPPGTTQVHLRLLPFANDGPGVDLIFGTDRDSLTIPEPVLGIGPYVMLPAMTYTWTARTASVLKPLVSESPEWGPWAPIHSFRTRPASAARIVPLAPAPGTASARTPTLQWRDADTSVFYYEVQLSADPAFAVESARAIASVYWNLVHGGLTSPLNSWAVPTSTPLAPGTRYYWRVRPRVQGDGQPVSWSSSFSFTTAFGNFARMVAVVDGDTLNVVRDGGQSRVRIIGVDTPEVYGTAECYGAEASSFTKSLVPAGALVTLEKDVSETDRYDRLLRYVWLGDGRMLNETLVAEGYARVSTYPPDVKYQERFLVAERTAREQGKGLWSACSAAPAPPPPAPAPSLPPPAPAPPPPPATGINVYISLIFADGLVPRVESDEYAVIQNDGPGDQDMSGWRLNAGDRGQDFIFPSGFVLAEGQSCRVYTNELHPEHCNGRAMSFGRGSALWANAGECGYLYNAQGREVSRRCY